jgi:hypothetical protein
MKSDLLSFQIGDQLFGAVNRDLIVYRPQQPATTLKPFINLETLLTHHIPPSSGGELPMPPVKLRRRKGYYVSTAI